MNIVQFFFGIFKECFNTMNVDFFGFGFTWLEFLFAGSLILIILKFVFSVVGVSDAIDTSAIVGGLAHQTRMINDKREQQIVRTFVDHNLDTGHGRITRSTQIIKNGRVTGSVNEYTKF